eukprot:2378821-Rhodomonas_salina.8
MDQMLEKTGSGGAQGAAPAAHDVPLAFPSASSAGARGHPLVRPVQEIASYTRQNGIRALYAGAVPLFLREFCYICAITVVNPAVTKAMEKQAADGSGPKEAWGVAGAFAVGASAGM